MTTIFQEHYKVAIKSNTHYIPTADFILNNCIKRKGKKELKIDIFFVFYGRKIIVKKGFIFDGVSTGIFKVFFKKFAKSTLSAGLLHDWLYSEYYAIDRKFADTYMELVLRYAGVPLWKRKAFFYAVRLFGDRFFKQCTTIPIFVNKILVTQNRTKYGWFGTWHSVFTNDDIVISYTGIHPFAKRKVVIIDRKEYNKNIIKTIQNIDITKFNISKYLNFDKKMVCHEFINHIMMKQKSKINFSNLTYKSMTKNAYSSFSKLFYIVSLIPIIYATHDISFKDGHDMGYKEGYSEGCHTIIECDEKFKIHSTWEDEQ